MFRKCSVFFLASFLILGCFQPLQLAAKPVDIQASSHTIHPLCLAPASKVQRRVLILTKTDYKYHLKQTSSGLLRKRVWKILSYVFTKIRSSYMGSIPHIGAGILATQLKASGFQVTIRDLYDPEMLKKAKSFDLVLVSFFDISFTYVMDQLLPNLDLNKTVIGGIGATVLGKEIHERFPNASLAYGEGEGLVPEIIRDLDQGLLKPVYKRDSPVDLSRTTEEDIQFHAIPPFDKNFIQVIEVGRGCTQHCPFCITPRFNPRVTYKPLDILEKELDMVSKGLRPKILVLIDQNLLAYPEDYLLQFFKMLNKRKIRWVGEGTIESIIHNDELLSEMAKNCLMFLVGVEDLSQNPVQGAQAKDKLKQHLKESVELLRSHKFPVLYSIVFGTDKQDMSIFETSAQAVHDLGITVIPHIATPRVGTVWYDHLIRQGRIFDFDFGGRDQKFHVIFHPNGMNYRELWQGFFHFHKKVFSVPEIARRLFYNVRRSGLKYALSLMLFDIDGFMMSHHLKMIRSKYATSA
jgi:radical SAM superfamily enzyme YgiQ (UPF0313 family)